MTPKVNWNPSPKETRKFGVTVFVGFLIIGALFFWRGKHFTAEMMWMISAGVMILSLVAPVLARPFYLLWMGFGVVMGAIMSRVILSVIFFGVVTPVALFFKMIGRDALRRKKPQNATYWEEHPKITDSHYYEHLS